LEISKTGISGIMKRIKPIEQNILVNEAYIGSQTMILDGMMGTTGAMLERDNVLQLVRSFRPLLDCWIITVVSMRALGYEAN